MNGFVIIRSILQFTQRVLRCISSQNNYDLSDSTERKLAAFYVALIDHGILRLIWTNNAFVADGVWRSNHPTHGRLKNLAHLGFKTIISLRGNLKLAPHTCEAESCSDLGMTLVSVPMSARSAPAVRSLIELISVLGEVEKPFLIHCKSGADRTGLASAVYLMIYCNVTPNEAKQQLSMRFLHFRKGGSGILDHFLDIYEERLGSGLISFEDWVTQEYDPEALSASFASLKRRKWKVQTRH